MPLKNKTSHNRGTSVVTLPIQFHITYGGIDWEISDENEEPQFLGFARSKVIGPNAKLPENWELVRQYLAVNATDQHSVLAFLRKYGWFKAPRESTRNAAWPPHDRVLVEQLSLKAFAIIQDYLRRVLLTRNPVLPTPWKPQSIEKHEIFFAGNRAEVIVHGIFPAILAIIQFKLVQGIPIRFCARRDCRLPFEVTSRHRRRFCTQYCAHIVSLRQRRKLERTANQKLGGNK